MVININVEFLAKRAGEAIKRGDLIIVIDVLRCSSSIISALANGAEAVIPVKTLKEAYRTHNKNPHYLLAGERGGLKPRGFDLGNSPLEYTHEKVNMKTIILTTTSGTLALAYSRDAKWVLIGSFLNAKFVAEKAVKIADNEGINISIVQSGTEGRFSLEDFICAGAIIDRLTLNTVSLSDAASASLLAFKQSKDNLCANVMLSSHSKRLVELGFRRDIEFSCQLDLLPVIPIYKNGVIKLMA